MPSPGSLLAGRYTITSVIGEGGFGQVYLGHDAGMDRPVAIKELLHDATFLSPEHRQAYQARFRKEAQVTSRFAHPNIVSAYALETGPHGDLYLILEYVDGGSLKQLLDAGEPLPIERAIAIAMDLCRAVEAIYARDIVHRDIKPSNILVTTFGVPVLADFGISASLTRVDGEQVFAMSVPWSAPEIIAEQTSGTVASEVWGLGATIYSLLAGHSPFERPERGQNTRDHLRRRIQRATYRRITRPDVPDELQRVLAIAMSREPADRYGSALEFAEALRDVQQELGLPPTPLEIAAAGWAPRPGTVDFDDASLRGIRRSRVAHDTRRRDVAPVPVVQRDEDAGIDGDESSTDTAPARVWWYALGGAAMVVAGIVWALVAGGVI